MIVSYYKDDTIDGIAQDFKDRLLYLLLIMGVFSLITATAISYFLSRKSSQNIEELSQMTNDYKNKNYNNAYEINSNIKEIADLYKNMKYLGETLDKQDKLRKDYSQNISHELRTPLTNLLLFVEAIDDGIIEIDDRTVKSLKEEISHMNLLIDKLRLDFNEDVAISENNIEEFNLTDTLSSISDSLFATANANGITLKTHLEEGVIVKSDKEKITQILYNLLSNAFKACSESDQVSLLMKKDADTIIVSVKDTGIGIAREEFENIFKRNYRVDNERNKIIKGSGLGLSICKELVNSIGGSIEIRSKVNYGSEFIVKFSVEL